ncbi:hypothetical protein EUGRSUZ_B02448 [Eucalyptus grandis]|uniref:Uncharacterized protein n=2 Tax=Eucalyptus grandis TaxID=71139 RepID=A0ACC3LTS3_EUCGR|nr:hypothetical protein EUGRSUZ_B02448 [Eucalyptus grandis]
MLFTYGLQVLFIICNAWWWSEFYSCCRHETQEKCVICLDSRYYSVFCYKWHDKCGTNTCCGEVEKKEISVVNGFVISCCSHI